MQSEMVQKWYHMEYYDYEVQNQNPNEWPLGYYQWYSFNPYAALARKYLRGTHWPVSTYGVPILEWVEFAGFWIFIVVIFRGAPPFSRIMDPPYIYGFPGKGSAA